MTSIPNTALRRMVRLIYLPAFFFFFSSVPFAHAATVSNDDNIVIGSADALSETDMSADRGSGGTVNITTVTSTQTMNSTSTGNTLNVGGSLTNGSISVGSNFGGSGFGSYVMNTGNNAVINSGVSLSVLTLQ
ncbi:MAG: hypothetical protein P4M13_01750 [Alphaproteobacteria bacterium]|nr:hypothetical protein [Alphaproteobacteria bacterium]